MRDYAAHIAAIHRELGIPADYAVARQLPLVEEIAAAERVSVPSPSTRPVFLSAPAAFAWERLTAAAAKDGLTLLPLSGFRDVARQVEIFRAKLSAGKTREEILRINAAPGHSEHHSGRAVDIGAAGEPPLTAAFERTAEFAWLAQHAGEFRFQLSYPRDNPHGIAFEPWHWCWRK